MVRLEAVVAEPVRARSLAWSVATGAALLFTAHFLTNLAKGYLIAAAIATLAALVAAIWGGRSSSSRWTLAGVAILVILLVWSAASYARIDRLDSRWEEVAPELQSRGLDLMLEALARDHAIVSRRAELALAGPQSPTLELEYLSRLADSRPERSVIVYREGRRAPGWGGVFRIDPDILTKNPSGVAFSDFFTVMYASARAVDGTLAVATTLVQATPPADRLAASLERKIALASGSAGFEILRPDSAAPGARPFVVGQDTLLLVRPLSLVQGQVRLQYVQRLLTVAIILLGLVAVLFLAVVWRRFPAYSLRAASLVVVLLSLSEAPLNQLSPNQTLLFDPSLYFSRLGGPLTANAGILLVTAALVLLALIALLRTSFRIRSRPLAVALVAGVAALGPFLLRAIARDASPQIWGVSTALWLAMQVAIFFAACAVLLAGVSAGRAALPKGRGVTVGISFSLALFAAALGPIIWEAPGRYPGWYPMLWILAIAALAFSRQSRGFMFATASVAALGAVTLAWSASIKQRVALAERDVRGLSNIDATASLLLERFGNELAELPLPRDRSMLLRKYVGSDLAAAEYPVELLSFDAENLLVARLALSRIETDPQLLMAAVSAARASGIPVQQEVRTIPGAQMMVAAPHSDGWVTAAVVAPRSRLIPNDPFRSLFGLARERGREPPYTLSVTEFKSLGGGDAGDGRWERRGDELHGDFALQTSPLGARAHVEVDLRGYDVLLQRGTLIVLLDIVLFAVLWSLAVAADGSLARWIQKRRHVWAQSYRARLTFALFGFFVVPAVVFAFWSQRGIIAGDRQSRELLLSEMLRAAEGDVGAGRLRPASERFDAPLFLYEGGRLIDSSDPLFVQLAPLGRRLPSEVFRQLELGDELTVSQHHDVGAEEALVGYRLIGGEPGQRYVLAAPARADQLAIDRRRRDLGVLVLFATAAGALAALWLSGIAARQLSRPIGILRGAALAIARGEREPPLMEAPRSEFAAVFAAFRQMAADLNASRSELVAAQRRTEAILRNVASGVVAFDSRGRVTLANPRSGALLGTMLASGQSLHDAELDTLDRHVASFLADSAEEMEFDEEVGGRQMHGRLTRLTAGSGGAVLTLDDVSELARAQRVIAWGQMARQVAHEIKNPLTPIRLGVQHLKRARTDRRADFDKILESNVGRILAEIDRLDEIARAFSRYGLAPAQRSESSPIDVGDIARDVLELEKMGEGEVEWSYTESEGALMAIASEDELREVLLNLLENARHAGARVVNMMVNRNGTTLSIAVEDDGHGIPEDILPHIFEPHFSTRSSGSGLGLAISRKLIEGWGGRISVASTPGKGTRVTIFLLAPREL